MTDHIEEVKTKSANWQKYKKITPQIFQAGLTLAKRIQAKKIIHLNSTQLGGGVSELLRSQVPLERSLGLDSHWFIIKAPLRFFKVTKKIHNLLQGEPGRLNETEKYFYLKWLYSKIAPSFKKLIAQEKPDIVIIHDPQPLPLIKYVPNPLIKRGTPILRLHIDLSCPNPSILKFLQPLIEKYQLVIFSHATYRPSWLPARKSKIIIPAIDPFTDKNQSMKKSEAEKILALYNINTDQPIVAQVSRFDPWKDPLGTLQAYYLAKNKIPQLQLILAGLFQAYDDPQAVEMFTKVQKQTKGDPDVFLFSDPRKLKEISNDLFINAVYTASTVIIQKSIKEGFGLCVTEAMWKGKAVVGGQTKGIALQIEDGKNGFLVSSPEEAAQYLIHLLENQSLRKKLGQAAHQTVKNKFLISRLVLDHLKIYTQL
jgi:trehalose synthase